MPTMSVFAVLENPSSDLRVITSVRRSQIERESGSTCLPSKSQFYLQYNNHLFVTVLSAHINSLNYSYMLYFRQDHQILLELFSELTKIKTNVSDSRSLILTQPVVINS